MTDAKLVIPEMFVLLCHDATIFQGHSRVWLLGVPYTTRLLHNETRNLYLTSPLQNRGSSSRQRTLMVGDLHIYVRAERYVSHESPGQVLGEDDQICFSDSARGPAPFDRPPQRSGCWVERERAGQDSAELQSAAQLRLSSQSREKSSPLCSIISIFSLRVY